MAYRAAAQSSGRATATGRRRKSRRERRTGVPEAAERESFRQQSIGKIHQNPRRRAPDVMGAVVEGIEFPLVPLPLHAPTFAARGIEKMIKRHFENGLHFVGIWGEGEVFRQKSDHRENGES